MIKVDSDEKVYYNIAMDSSDAYENFMNFIFWVKSTKIGQDYRKLRVMKLQQKY